MIQQCSLISLDAEVDLASIRPKWQLWLQGSDMEGDDDDYQEMDNSVVPNQDDDFFFHLEDMQVGSK